MPAIEERQARADAATRRLAAMVPVPVQVARHPILVAVPFSREAAEDMAERLEWMARTAGERPRALMFREATHALEAYAQVDESRVRSLWDVVDADQALRSRGLARKAGLPADPARGSCRFPRPREWNPVPRLEPPRSHRLEVDAQVLELFREVVGRRPGVRARTVPCRLEWRFRVRGSDRWLRTPSISPEDLERWEGPAAAAGEGRRAYAEAMKHIIQSDEDPDPAASAGRAAV